MRWKDAKETALCKGAFTIRETEADTETETDKMAIVPNGIRVPVQYKYLHTILIKPFLSISVSVSVNTSLLGGFKENPI